MTTRITKLSVTLVGLLLIGCSTSKAPDPVPVTTTKTRNAPTWIDNPATLGSGVIVGVGVEGPNLMGDIMMQRKVALAAARSEIAKQMNTRVQGLFGSLSEQYKAAGKEGAKVISTESMARMVSDTQRELVNVELVGATPREFWTDPETKTLYVLVTLDKESSDRAIKAAATSALQKEIAKGNAGLQDAMSRLDSTLANQK